MIYVGGALFVYMLFINPDFYLAKWIVIGVSVCVCVYCECVHTYICML